MCSGYGVHQVPVPRAWESSQFTPTFEAIVRSQMQEMPFLNTACMVTETNTTLRRAIYNYVPKARVGLDRADVQAVGIGKTSSRRGHGHITLFAGLEAPKRFMLRPARIPRSLLTVSRTCALKAAIRKLFTYWEWTYPPFHGRGPLQVLTVFLDASTASSTKAKDRGVTASMRTLSYWPT